MAVDKIILKHAELFHELLIRIQNSRVIHHFAQAENARMAAEPGKILRQKHSSAVFKRRRGHAGRHHHIYA
ncbi:hypothetical protein SDC9_193706 [bioreactor metagenome]|uniref:Uncharacterized protein n=1 Tax=bioreactor metagenome TaxID=1076179 RepID=A0A645IFH5_9ZZZZ